MEQLEEGIHYYMEKERVIFTALFHIKRGQCCGSGCRHCPFDPKYTKGKVVVAEKYIKFIDNNFNNGTK